MCRRSNVSCCRSRLESLGERRRWDMFCAGGAPVTTSELSHRQPCVPRALATPDYPTFLLYSLAQLRRKRIALQGTGHPRGSRLDAVLYFCHTHLTRHAVRVVYEPEGCGWGKRVRLRYPDGCSSHKGSGSHYDMEGTPQGAEVCLHLPPECALSLAL